MAAETLLYASLFLAGVFGLSLVIAIAVTPVRNSIGQYVAIENLPRPSGMPDGGDGRVTQILLWIFGTLSLGVAAISLGQLIGRIGRVAASDEYRGSISTRFRDRFRPRGWTALDGDRPRRSDPGSDLDHLPAVPSTRTLVDSPGERLAYRLPATPARDRLIGTTVLAMLWNGSWFVLLAIAVDGFLQSQPRPIMAMLLVPLGFIGWKLLRRMVDVVQGRGGLGPTIVEISDHPLHPGGTYDLFVSQRGRLRLRDLTVRLVCEEEAIFSQGTDVRRENHAALDRLLYQSGPIRVDPGRPWEQQWSFTFDDGVMHSFVAQSNAIHWRLVISGHSKNSPPFCRTYSLVVHPPLKPPPSSPR